MGGAFDLMYKKIKRIVYFSLRRLLFLTDDVFFRFLLLFPHKETPSRKNRVIFVIDSPGPRVYKIMKQLYKNGYEIISFYRIKRGADVEAEIRPYSSCIKHYISAHEAYAYCRKYQGGIFHVFCCYVYDVPELLIKKKVGKVIFDNYDGYSGFVVGWNQTKEGKKNTAVEQFCLENADGLTCRSFESQYQKRYLGYRYKGKRLLFFDYCSTESQRYKNNHQINESPIFFYGGGVPDEIDNSDGILSCITEAAKILSDKSCQLLVYHMRTTKELEAYYAKKSKEIPGFSFHGMVPFEEMLAVMQKCDFAIFPAKWDYLKEYEHGSCRDGEHYYEKYIYGAANKYFDAIEVGLPMIGGPLYYLAKMLERDGMAVYCPVEELADKLPYLKEHYDELRANIEKNAEKYSIEKNIHRLIAFYEQIKAAPPIEIDK